MTRSKRVSGLAGERLRSLSVWKVFHCQGEQGKVTRHEGMSMGLGVKPWDVSVVGVSSIIRTGR